MIRVIRPETNPTPLHTGTHKCLLTKIGLSNPKAILWFCILVWFEKNGAVGGDFQCLLLISGTHGWINVESASPSPESSSSRAGRGGCDGLLHLC